MNSAACSRRRPTTRWPIATRCFGAVAKQANIDRKFFDWWFDRTSTVPAVFGDAHAKAVTTAWNIGLPRHDPERPLT
ncbi:MAG: hypothetical protein IPI73_30905 [Betaproteobacteria bacterium]|nr:hypothetical protein [Betaproteobacteria bacterium]